MHVTKITLLVIQNQMQLCGFSIVELQLLCFAFQKLYSTFVFIRAVPTLNFLV